MAIQTYQGESHRLIVTIKDSGGTTLNPESGFSNIIVYILHRSTYEIIAKYSIQTLSGYSTATVDSDTVICILDSSQSKEAKQGLYEVQVDLMIADAGYEDGVKIIRQKGVLMQLNPATNG